MGIPFEVPLCLVVPSAEAEILHPANTEYIKYYSNGLRYPCNISAIPEPQNVTWSFSNTQAFLQENETSDVTGRCDNTVRVQRELVWATDDLDVRKAAANSTLTCSGESSLGVIQRTIRLDVQCKCYMSRYTYRMHKLQIRLIDYSLYSLVRPQH